VLTFLAYAWSGYGAGLLANLRDAVLAAETVFQDLFANAITVAKKIKDIHEVFDAAVEEHCVFQCPDGAYSGDAISSVIVAVIGSFSNDAPLLVDSVDRFARISLAFNCTFYTPFLSPVPLSRFFWNGFDQIPINLINDMHLSIHINKILIILSLLRK